MSPKYLIAGAFIFFFAFNFNSAADDRAGTTGAAFLKISPGARASALGESFTALSNDAYALYYNPSGIAPLKNDEISAMYAIWFADIKYGYLGYCHPTDIGVFGISLIYLTSGEIESYTVDSNNEPVAASSFSSNDLAVGVSYGYRILTDLYFGVTLKYINESIAGSGASGFAFDIGTKYTAYEERLFLGLALQNIGTTIKFIDEAERLPFNIKLGIALREDILILTSDFTIPSDNAIKFGVGAELLLLEEIVAVRFGYTKRLDADEFSEGLAYITGGMGFLIESIALDYAFVPYGNLGYTHRISLGVKF